MTTKFAYLRIFMGSFKKSISIPHFELTELNLLQDLGLQKSCILMCFSQLLNDWG